MDLLFRAEMKYKNGRVEGTYHYSADKSKHYILRRERFIIDVNYVMLHRQEIKLIKPETLEISDGNGNWILWDNVNIKSKLD